MAQKRNVTITLVGPIPSKKNSRVKPRNCNFTIPSHEYFEWQDYARREAKLAWRRAPTTASVRITVMTSCRNDIDNLIQSVMDALEGIVYENDRQVVGVQGQKIPKNKEPYKTIVAVDELVPTNGGEKG